MPSTHTHWGITTEVWPAGQGHKCDWWCDQLTNLPCFYSSQLWQHSPRALFINSNSHPVKKAWFSHQVRHIIHNLELLEEQYAGSAQFPNWGAYVSSLDRDGGLENPGLKKAECYISAVHQATQRQLSPTTHSSCSQHPYSPAPVYILQSPHKLHVIIIGHSPKIETSRSPLDCMPSTQFHLARIPLPLSVNSTKVLMPRY